MTVPPTIADVPARYRQFRNRDVELGLSFWIVPVKLSVSAILLSVATVVIDSRLQEHYQDLPEPLRMTVADSKTILSTLAGASITVVALVVSLMMVVLSLVAANFGPRIILNFARRRTTKQAIGSFVAVFVYSLITLTTVFSGSDQQFVPVVSTWTAVVLVLAATALLVVFVQDVSSSIQIGNMLFEIATELDGAIDRQRLLARRAHASPTTELDTTGWPVVDSILSGYVQRIDFDALIALAARLDLVIVLHHRAGSFVNAGRPLASTSKPLPAADITALRATVVRGTYRTMEQDLEYAIAEYVEIALRALSPAVNDPATAISCVEWIGDSLIALSAEPIGVAEFADGTGALRVVVPPTSLRRVVAAAFNEIRQVVSRSPVVTIRMLTTIARIAPVVVDPAAREELRGQVEAISFAADRDLSVQRDRDDVEAATLEAMTALA
jgi:uncharacterized membrane protein